jgi:RNA polymerase sigma-70 factor (ECF subfamily)
LLIRYRDTGDVDAFDVLVHRYEKPIFSYLLRYLRNASLAEDVLQATFLRLHQKRRLFSQNRRLRPWLYSIATHLAIDALRSEGKHQASSLDALHTAGDEDMGTLLNVLQARSALPEEEIEVEERAEWIHAALDSLPDELRVLLLLIYFQGLKFHEAAEALELPLGTVKSRVHRALLMLSHAWRRNHLNEGGSGARCSCRGLRHATCHFQSSSRSK